jgi:hypothetical protein
MFKDPRVGTPEEDKLAIMRHDLSMERLENSRIKRQLEIQKAITQEWMVRFDKLLALIPAIKHDPPKMEGANKPGGWWHRLFTAGTDRPFCP